MLANQSTTPNGAKYVCVKGHSHRTRVAADKCCACVRVVDGHASIASSSVVSSAPYSADSLTSSRRADAHGRALGIVSESQGTNVNNAATCAVAQDAALSESRTLSGESSPRTGGHTMSNVLSIARMRELQSVQGTRGVLGSLVSKAVLLTNGVYYVDVIADSPALTTTTNRDGDALQYSDDDGNFSLAKLASAVKSTVDRKRKDALAAGHNFPNIETVRDDDAGTVYIVNWDNAPDDTDSETV